jgi:acyl-coenzyme A synthetase/AMP-(fatty) acid ligase
MMAGATTAPELPDLIDAVSSGSPLPADVAVAVAARCAFALHNGYGSSETGAISLARARVGMDPGDVGVPLPGVTARLVPVPGMAEAGELQLRTDSLAAGYLADGGLRPLNCTDGWYRTGDLAVLSDGRILLRGRVGTIINVAGRKVSPLEIERVVATHPSVAEVQVIAAEDAVRGQVPLARVVVRAAVTAAELTLWCQERLAPHQMPRQIVFLDDLPRSATGKVIKSR